jgi:hypothetical protein
MRRVMGMLMVFTCAIGSIRCGSSSTAPSSTTTTTTTQTGTPFGTTSLGWKFAADGITLSNGGSPTGWQLGANTLLYLSSGPTCCTSTALTSTDGLHFSPLATTNITGNEFSFVTLPDGRHRMYYQSAPFLKSRISTDGKNWTDESGNRFDLTGPAGPVGAVPRVVEVPGGYRVYYALLQGGPTPINISSAFSADGLTFTKDAGERLIGQSGNIGWGDPNVVKTDTGYLMAVMYPAGISSFFYLATSTDSLTWTLDSAPIVSDTRGSVVDSSWLPLGGNRFRLYYCVFLGRGSASPAPFTFGQPNTDIIISGVVSRQ